jgi:hypothetical protein
MVTINVHVRQDLGEWVVTAVLTESHGAGLAPSVSTSEYHMPLTEREWDSDPLSAGLSAVSRWVGKWVESGMTGGWMIR